MPADRPAPNDQGSMTCPPQGCQAVPGAGTGEAEIRRGGPWSAEVAQAPCVILGTRPFSDEPSARSKGLVPWCCRGPSSRACLGVLSFPPQSLTHSPLAGLGRSLTGSWSSDEARRDGLATATDGSSGVGPEYIYQLPSSRTPPPAHSIFGKGPRHLCQAHSWPADQPQPLPSRRATPGRPGPCKDKPATAWGQPWEAIPSPYIVLGRAGEAPALHEHRLYVRRTLNAYSGRSLSKKRGKIGPRHTWGAV
ncbi:hypothetical protein NDU88_005967 [Pleurodeles waltl]|uniref:Uncharacterized protein n=1 Tax=Pleurodeles waltl TaxID=8319 RepID=A0AAV7MXY3_PLEWA|nr:hypothetical protein NDU88_005967 [Pleurodeles waltl]